MRQLTLATCRESIARVLNCCATDARVPLYANEAEERLLNRPDKPVGSFTRYEICVNNACLTWPRQVRSIEAFAICDHPGLIRNGWWEYGLNGLGILGDLDMAGDILIDRGTACAFDDITAGATDRKIRITTDIAEGATKYIWLYGYDENSNWIRTQIGGVWYDGERVQLSTAPTLTTHFFTVLSRVIKDVTDGPVRLYEYNTTTAAVVRALAYYEPSETQPIYRRSFVPGITVRGTCCGSTTECENKKITVMVRLQHVPVVAENDFFVIGNLPALKDMVQSIRAKEENRLADAAAFEASAIRELDGELAAYLGDGEVTGLRVDDREVYGAAVFNVI